MAARVIDVLTPAGRQFERILQELADKEVAVGFQHGDATEEDGTDICDIAAWNELGTEHGSWIIPRVRSCGRVLTKTRIRSTSLLITKPAN